MEVFLQPFFLFEISISDLKMKKWPALYITDSPIGFGRLSKAVIVNYR